ncbi:MAG TPA: methyl-accepting chemotaxis protein [Myxococcales bacterium]|jgi:methyl-accepting chemotaxis protein
MANSRLSTLSFRSRLLLFAGVLALLPLILLGAVSTSWFRNALTDQVLATVQGEATSAETGVETALLERTHVLRSLVENPIISGALMFNAFEKSDEVFSTTVKRYPDFKGLALFSPDGQVVSASNAELKSRLAGKQDAVRGAAWFSGAAKEQRLQNKDIASDPTFGGRVLYLALPLVNAEKQTLGVLLGAYDWDSLVSRLAPDLERAAARGQKTFRYAIVNPAGEVLLDTGGVTELPRRRMAELAKGTPQGHGDADEWTAAWSNKEDGVIGDAWIFFSLVDRGEAFAVVTKTLLLTLLLVLLIGVAAMVAAVFTSRSMVKPINDLNAAVSHIVKSGDLTRSIEVGASDEIGQLAGSFGKMVGSLQEMILALQESGRLLSEQVSALTTITAEQGQSVTRQATAIQETQVTANEIRQTSQMAAQKAEEVIAVAQHADELGREGESTIEKSMTGLNEIRSQVGEIASKIGQLKDRTKLIGKITGTVKDIADQSNMLALNAAIEAVRSGEHGKGFAVVAREIRSLADQSVQSTNRVSEILDDITAAIEAAVGITEAGSQRMEANLGQTKQSGENLRELSGIVKENSSAVRQIGAAVSQQNAGISQIFTAVTDLSKVVDETMKRSESINRAGDALKSISKNIESLVGSYKVKVNGSTQAQGGLS